MKTNRPSELMRGQKTLTREDLKHVRFIFRCMYLGAYLVALSLFYIWSRVEVVSIGYAISEKQQVFAQLLEDNRKLQVEVAMLKSPQRLQDIAQKQFGMQPPVSEQIVALPHVEVTHSLARAR
jgi:cell division protein FtsL